MITFELGDHLVVTSPYKNLSIGDSIKIQAIDYMNEWYLLEKIGWTWHLDLYMFFDKKKEYIINPHNSCNHSWKEEYWFSKKLVKYCSKCGKTPEESCG